MILVAGGTGRLGTLVVGRLTARGEKVRVLTRSPVNARHLLPNALIEVVTGDVRQPASLAPALADVQTVVSAVHGFAGQHGSPRSVDDQGNANLIDAAAVVGADVVLMSIVGAAKESPMELFRMKYRAEEKLKSGTVPWTIVRATAFLELWADLLLQTAGRSGRPLVFGRGNNPINFVSVLDVAALVETAVLDRSTRGQVLEIGGEQNLTFNELAKVVLEASGRPDVVPRHLPPVALSVMANTIGRLKPELGRQARAAICMDRDDFRFDGPGARKLFPELPATSLAAALNSRKEGQE